VLSCFKTKPRRRPNQAPEDVSDRNAFGVCVSAANRDRFLDPDSWPDSIRISDWYFRDRNGQVNTASRNNLLQGRADDTELIAVDGGADVTGRQASVAATGVPLATGGPVASSSPAVLPPVTTVPDDALSDSSGNAADETIITYNDGGQ